MSPIYPQLQEAGAVFGQSMGYERPNYFDLNDKHGECIDNPFNSVVFLFSPFYK